MQPESPQPNSGATGNPAPNGRNAADTTQTDAIEQSSVETNMGAASRLEKSVVTPPQQRTIRRSLRIGSDTGSAADGHTPNAPLEYTEERQGRHPGDKYIRFTPPTERQFRALSDNTYEAQFARDKALNSTTKFYRRFKRILVGEPLSTAQSAHERLTKVKALAVLSSDALSSVAYATQEIVKVLVIFGAVGASALTAKDSAIGAAIPIAIAIVVLLGLVALSYRQTIEAYPKGGGSYIVAKDNLNVNLGLIAGAALMIDYVLTVAVSISSGVQAVTSLFPQLHDIITPLFSSSVWLALFFTLFICVVNLRGVRESGNVFTIPTYLFIAAIFLMLGMGFFRVITGQGPVAGETFTQFDPKKVTESVSVFIILQAFASGCSAMTGVEAISDGVPAFKEPEYKNAQTTLTAMAVILGIMFLGITFLTAQFNLVYYAEGEAPSILSQLGRAIFGGNSPLFFLLQIFTMAILVLAANTSFSDFPRLSSFLARDKFLPHVFKHRGDRLSFSAGIITLALLSAVLIIVFNASTDALIPLYAIGVFTSFTLSQSGMVMRWLRLRGPGWWWRMAFNATGAIATLVVLGVVAYVKTPEGAWVVILLIPAVWLLFKSIHRHYVNVAQQLRLPPPDVVDHLMKAKSHSSAFGGATALDKDKMLAAGRTLPSGNLRRNPIIVPIDDVNRLTLRSLRYAKSVTDDVTAVHVAESEDEISAIRERWQRYPFLEDVPLVILASPYRSINGPLLAYVDNIHRRDPEDLLTVIITEFIPAHWWETPLHNQTAYRLRRALGLRPNIVVTSIPYRLQK